MKKIIIIISVILAVQSLSAQIDGNLLLGLASGTTTEINTATNPQTGSIVYNTTDFSLYQYNGGTWVRIFDSANNGTTGTKVNYGGRWTNTDITTNLNITDAIAPIFGVEDYKDDSTTLYEVSGNTLTVKEAGRYEIKANLSFVNISGARNNPTARIAIDGTQTGSRAASGYTRNASNHTQSSIHINETLNLSANDVLSIEMFQEGSTGEVRFSAANESSFIINKLQ